MTDAYIQLMQTKNRFILIIKIDPSPHIAALKFGKKHDLSVWPFLLAILSANAQLPCSFSYGQMHVPFQVIQIIFAVLSLYNNIENMHDYILSWSHILLINK